MTPEDLSRLAEKYLAGKATPEERRLLDEWYYEHPADGWVAEIHEDEAHLGARMLARLQPAPVRRLPRWAAAAALVLALGIGGAVYFAAKHPVKAPVQALAHDVAPGSQRALLTLSDGSTVELDSSRDAVLASQGGSRVRQVKGGELAYEKTSGKTEPLWNTLSVPRGGQYKLVLPDGSKVWLNAASSIRYPVAFTGSDRVVEMTGEAYFEVAQDPTKPFRVKVGNREAVEVLGTHFDINAYDDESAIRTTLLEGGINVSAEGRLVTLRPGEEAVLDKALQVHRVEDLEAAVAWKDGLFFFDGENITSIMRQVSRWYDVTVDYQGDVQDKVFTGEVSRYANVSQVLNVLELTRDIHFTIEGNKITVMP